MPILADAVDGARRRRHPTAGTLAAAAVTPIGRVIAQAQTSADTGGYRTLLDFARTQVPGQRCWAVEGTGSYGAGLACFLLSYGERVVEVGRPKRPASRSGAKSDAVDAVRAARAALAFDHPPAPRRRGDREALRVLLPTRHGAVKARVEAINQPQGAGGGRSRRAARRARAAVPPAPRSAPVPGCAPAQPSRSGHRATVRALRATAQRVQLLQAEADELQAELTALVGAIAPWLLELPGVGPISAAQVLVSWSSAGRLHSKAAFAALAGVSPIPASSGQVTRHRLNRSGDRQLNRALHTIVVARLRDDPDTRAYAARRAAQGKSPREIRRCRKRFVARQLFKLLESCDQPGAEILRAA